MKTFLKSYLYKRYIVTRINDSLSSKDCIEYGVPQGSVLGPLFLILFINDMPTILKDAVNINLNLYADDTSLTIYADNNELLTKYLQLYIDKLVYWFNINKLKLNIEKTKMLPFMNARILKDIYIGNSKIEIVGSYKFLGLILDQHLTFKKHIEYLANKLSSIIYFMKKVSFLSTENMILLYNFFFLSNISYGIEIWGNTYKSNINIIMLLQKKIIRIINKKILNLNLLPLIRLSNTSELFISNNILKLNDLVMFRNIILIYKLLNKNYKIDFNEYFTLNKRKDRFILPLMKTTKYQNTIFFKGIKYYNDIIFGNILKKNKITNINKL